MALMNLGMGGNFAPVRQDNAAIDPSAFVGPDDGSWQTMWNKKVRGNQTYSPDDPNARLIPWDELQRQMTEHQAALDASQRNQQGYAAQQGGNFTGGLMANAPAYTQPFSGQITGFQAPSAPMAGFGQMGQAQAPSMGSPASAWGGAFTPKNPWSLG